MAYYFKIGQIGAPRGGLVHPMRSNLLLLVESAKRLLVQLSAFGLLLGGHLGEGGDWSGQEKLSRAEFDH
jgi:hypothetical protein